MKNWKYCLALSGALALSQRGVASAEDKPVRLVPVLKINKELDKRTEIKTVGNTWAGNGLFAVTAIKQGDVIGELGGRLVAAEDYPSGNYYLASIPECAWEETKPYKISRCQRLRRSRQPDQFCAQNDQ
jgi:hypothetical protein